MIFWAAPLCFLLLTFSEAKAERREARQYNEYEDPSAPGMPYSFAYTVRDDETYNNFGHKEESTGRRTEGEYFVNLPDGRTQVVTYYVDGDSGFVADVKYLNEKDPSYKPTNYSPKKESNYAPAPYRAPAPYPAPAPASYPSPAPASYPSSAPASYLSPAPTYPQTKPSYNEYSPSRNSYVGNDIDTIFPEAAQAPYLPTQSVGYAPSRSYNNVGPSQKVGRPQTAETGRPAAARPTPAKQVRVQQPQVNRPAATSPSRGYSSKIQNAPLKPRVDQRDKQPVYVNKKQKAESPARPSVQETKYQSGLTNSRQYVLSKPSEIYSDGALTTSQNKKTSVSQLPLRRPSESEPLDLSVKEALAKYSQKSDTLFRDNVDARYNEAPNADPAFKSTKQYFVNDGEFGQKLTNPKPGFKPSRQYILDVSNPVSNSLSAVDEPTPVFYTTQNRPYASNLVSSLNIPEGSYKDQALTRQYKVNKDMYEANSDIVIRGQESPYFKATAKYEEPALSRQYLLNQADDAYRSFQDSLSKSKDQYATQQSYNDADAQRQEQRGSINEVYDKFIKSLSDIKESSPREPSRELARQYLVNSERQPTYSLQKNDISLDYYQDSANYRQQPSLSSQYLVNKQGSSLLGEPRAFTSQHYASGQRSYKVSDQAQKREDTATKRVYTSSSPLYLSYQTPVSTPDTTRRQYRIQSRSLGTSGEKVLAKSSSSISELSPRSGEPEKPKTATVTPSTLTAKPLVSEAKRKGVVLHAYVDSNQNVVIAGSQKSSKLPKNIQIVQS